MRCQKTTPAEKTHLSFQQSRKGEIELTVRQADIKDFERIQSFSKQAAGLHIQNRPDIFKASPEISKSEFKRLLKDKNIFILVAEQNGEIVGYCKLRMLTCSVSNETLTARAVGLIDEFFVDEKHRRQGIGTEFFGGVKAFAMSKGAQSIELYVWSFNEPARKLYESLGMKTQRTLMELKL